MYVEEYCEYLKKEKDMALNTIEAYRRDVLEFGNFMEKRASRKLEEGTETDMVAYMLELKDGDKSSATINRKLASLRAFYNFMLEKNLVKLNPTAGIKSPKIERKQVDYLSKEEVNQLLELEVETNRGKRNRAILETMYATGLRAKEVIEIDVNDVNLKIGFLSCDGNHGKARVIPLGKLARQALQSYVEDVRKDTAKENEQALFLNYHGERMTRQGLWKILKECGEKAGLKRPMTPNILRNSFAIHMIQNGADIKSMQELLGHEDLASTQIYEEFVRAKIKDVYDNTHPRA